MLDAGQSLAGIVAVEELGLALVEPFDLFGRGGTTVRALVEERDRVAPRLTFEPIGVFLAHP